MQIKYRADHVGSLLRPQEIVDARRGSAVTPEQLRKIEDRHIPGILQRQKTLGFEIFTDGEFRRWGFMSGFNDAIDGLADNEMIPRTWQGAADPPPSTVSRARRTGVVVQRIRQKTRLAKHELDFLRQHSPGDIKITLPSPNQFPAIAYKKGRSEQAYENYSAFLWDIVPVIRSEVNALVNEGARYIQIDAPRYSYYLDPTWRDYICRETGVNPDNALDEAIRADNACLEAAHCAGVIVAMHLCRGNNRSRWYADGGYEPVAEKLFNELNVNLFLLEYDSSRAGTFEPLRFMPRDKGVVLGLVSTKHPALESAAHLARRIDDASRYVPLEHLALSPQCGFASTFEGNLLSEDEQWRKLQLVVDTARTVWA